MKNYSFYHFENTEKELAAIALLENIAVKKGKKVRFMIPQDEQQAWDNVLWSKKQLSFIPHNIEGENTFKTKVYLTSKPSCETFVEDAVMTANPEELEGGGATDRFLYLIDNAKLQHFKKLFYKLKEAGHICNYHVFAGGAWSTRDVM